jgi:hypothetical protein
VVVIGTVLSRPYVVEIDVARFDPTELRELLSKLHGSLAAPLEVRVAQGNGPYPAETVELLAAVVTLALKRIDELEA